jgi:hypothetical protein
MMPSVFLFLKKEAEICLRTYTDVSQPTGTLSHSILRYRPLLDYGENNPFFF